MIKDTKVGSRDKRGYWWPNKKLSYGPVVIWPPQPKAFLRWLLFYPGYIFPWNFLYTVLAVLVWIYATPSVETMKTFSMDWIFLVFIRNIILAILVFGLWHFWLYTRRSQQSEFKYNSRWPDSKSKTFLFKNQTIDNMIWTLCSGVPIWSFYESICLWAYSSGLVPWVSMLNNPYWIIVLLFLNPFIHEIHFYFAHRLTHVKFLYKWVHYLHHKNTNPGPWSGLAMHPIEHIIYFSGMFIYLIIPSHPINMLAISMREGLAPAQGHTGFDKIILSDKTTVDISVFNHYLHHKYFECNYSDGTIPLDKWFGSFHDGSNEATVAIKERARSFHIP